MSSFLLCNDIIPHETEYYIWIDEKNLLTAENMMHCEYYFKKFLNYKKSYPNMKYIIYY